MTERSNQEELFADVAVTEQPTSDEVLAYVRGDAELSSEQRRAIEARIAASPAFRDRVAVLRRFVASREEQASEEAVRAAGSSRLLLSAAVVPARAPVLLSGRALLALGLLGLLVLAALLASVFSARRATLNAELALRNVEVAEARLAVSTLFEALERSSDPAAARAVEDARADLAGADEQEQLARSLARGASEAEALPILAELETRYAGMCSRLAASVPLSGELARAARPCARLTAEAAAP